VIAFIAVAKKAEKKAELAQTGEAARRRGRSPIVAVIAATLVDAQTE
jgi:hypothetical protein